MEENNKMQSLECHFNWDLDKPINETLDERICANEKHIEYNAKDTLPESYCHQAYLQSLKDNPDYDKILESINKADDIVEELIEFSRNKDFNNLPIGSGMKAVILANKAICLSKRNNTGDDIETTSCYDQYLKLKEKYLGNLAEHPEVLLAKAFSLRRSINHERVGKAVTTYEQTLSNIDYWEQMCTISLQDKYCDVLYSLVLSKFKTSQDRTLSSKELEDIELFLRRAIQVNPENHQAILKLAEVLAKTLDEFLLDEVLYFIKKAEKLNKDGRNIIILEGIATVYETMKYGDQIENKKKAIEYYDRAKEINPKSRRSLLGISTCNYQLYELTTNTERAQEPNIDEKERYLNISKNAIEKHKENSELKLAEKLNLATIFMALEKLGNGNASTKRENYLGEAETLYKEIIKKSEKEGDQFRLLEAYAGYAELFDNKGDTVKKIEFLKKVVKNVSKHNYDNSQVQQCVHDSQTKLLSYADEQPDEEKFKLKGWVQLCRGKVHNAIFYYRQALDKIDDEKSKSLFTGELIDLLLKASDKDYHLYHGNFAKQLLDEAVNKIETMSDKVGKCTFMYNAMCIEVKKNMDDSDEIKRILELRLDFERKYLDYIKDMASTGVVNKKRKEALSQNVLDVVSESKRLLDQGMDMIKKKLYNENSIFCYYPGPQKLESIKKNILEKRKKENKQASSSTSNEATDKNSNKETADNEAKEEALSIEEKMKYLLEERYKWTEFSIKLPGLFQYLVDKQPVNDDKFVKYGWLQNFINVRDEREHNHKHMEIMQKLFTTSNSQRDLARNCSNYAAAVWKTIKAKTDRFKDMEICRKEFEDI